MPEIRQGCDVLLIRGDSFTLTIGLGPEWAETVANAAAFQGRFVVRRRQDDHFPPLMTLTAPLTPNSDPAYGDLVGLFHFEASARKTQLLPPEPLVCYGEVAGFDGQYVRRLFEGRIRTED